MYTSELHTSKIGVCFVLYVCLFICDHILTLLNYVAPHCIFWYYWKTLNKAMCTLIIFQICNQELLFLLNLDFHWKLKFKLKKCVFNQSMSFHIIQGNAFAFPCHGEMHGNFPFAILPLNHFNELMPFHVT
jgi:hypothetical protein